MGQSDETFRWGGGSSTGCGALGGFVCVQVDHVAAIPSTPPPPANARIVFVSDSLTSGGGIAPMDLACQAEWEAEEGLSTGRTFKALIATEGVAASARFSSEDRVWIRTDGVVIADSTSEFYGGNWKTSIHAGVDGARRTTTVTTGAPQPGARGPPRATVELGP